MKNKDYSLHLILFIIFIAILASSCSTPKSVQPSPIEKQYFFLHGQIVMVPHLENN